MEHVDFAADLQGLNESLRRMQALLAWHRLKEQEAKPGQPPSFQMYDPTVTDLQHEYSLFLCMHIRVRAAINQSSRTLSDSVRTKIRKELEKLERQVHHLGLSAGRWRP
jgi:hypothetical protein